MIIAAEVLEHVEHPAQVVESLLQKLNIGGTMCISVPYGPWEALGYNEHKGWRAHIHHLERQDLLDMFGMFDDYSCLALPHSHDLGHFVLTFTKSSEDKKCGSINYERKLKHQRAQQSLTVCMIAKDEGAVLGKALESIREFADEIIIGIDNTTKDNTREVAERYGAKIFYIQKYKQIPRNRKLSNHIW